MPQEFQSFVVFAEMRTGSNFLESNLNAFDAITCHGEAFNPHFIGYPNETEILGVTQAMRDADPGRLFTTIRDQAGLGGFRYFHDHDPRILPVLLDDATCAKIVLTRNPADSYVSWKIAQQTGQWKLTNVQKRKDSRAIFDADEFAAHLEALQDFQLRLMNALQTRGQTAFYVAYEDIQDIGVMNGLARYLGVDQQMESLKQNLKRQNPAPLAEKVANFDVMEAALARLDRFNLTRTPNFEPRRGPHVPGYIAAARTPLLHLPLKSGPEAAVLRWLAAVDDVGPEHLLTQFSQKSLRQWKRGHPGHRSFAVLRHPLARAHTAFCNHILSTGKGSFPQIRRTLIRQHNMPLPDDPNGPRYDRRAHRAAFGAFLEFVQANLSGQTGVRVDAHWATQTACLQGMAEFALPDMLVRENEMSVYLPALAMQAGHVNPPEPMAAAPETPHALADIYDDALEGAAREAYQRDYLMFGFGDWVAPEG